MDYWLAADIDHLIKNHLKETLKKLDSDLFDDYEQKNDYYEMQNNPKTSNKLFY